MAKLTASGLNVDAVVVLLADLTKLGKKDIKAVLLGLNDLARKYTIPKPPE